MNVVGHDAGTVVEDLGDGITFTFYKKRKIMVYTINNLLDGTFPTLFKSIGEVLGSYPKGREYRILFDFSYVTVPSAFPDIESKTRQLIKERSDLRGRVAIVVARSVQSDTIEQLLQNHLLVAKNNQHVFINWQAAMEWLQQELD